MNGLCENDSVTEGVEEAIVRSVRGGARHMIINAHISATDATQLPEFEICPPWAS